MASKFLNKKSALAAILAGAALAALPTAQAMPQSTESATAAQSILANAAVEASPPIGLTIEPAAGNASLMAYHTSHASHASHVSHASHTSSHY